MRKRAQFWISIGVAAGLIVWAYDYEFFLNPGGPATPISDAIRHFSHLEYASFPLIVIWPVVVLAGGGALIGWALSWLFARKR